MRYFDRYSEFRDDGSVSMMPFVPILDCETDLFVVFDKSKMRFDTLSYKYYGDPNFGWMILQANPELGGYEYLVKDGVTLRIPYPLESAINRYKSSVRSYVLLNR